MVVSSARNASVDVPSDTHDRGAVLVVSERRIDALRVSQLLGNSGFGTFWVNNPDGIHQHCSQHNKSTEHFVGTVLCHRSLSAVRPDHSLPSDMPGRRVIVLSDCISENTVVSALENGAHHFFSINDSEKILQARLDAAFRSHHTVQEQSVAFGDIRFDIQKRKVSRAGLQVDLSPKEYELAYYLFSNRERVVGNSELMTSIWSLPPSMDTRRIDTAACRLRKKLQLKANNGWELKRLRSVGYKLVEGYRPESSPDSASRLSIVPV